MFLALKQETTFETKSNTFKVYMKVWVCSFWNLCCKAIYGGGKNADTWYLKKPICIIWSCLRIFSCRWRAVSAVSSLHSKLVWYTGKFAGILKLNLFDVSILKHFLLKSFEWIILTAVSANILTSSPSPKEFEHSSDKLNSFQEHGSTWVFSSGDALGASHTAPQLVSGWCNSY